jgi:hypothetical protein
VAADKIVTGILVYSLLQSSLKHLGQILTKGYIRHVLRQYFPLATTSLTLACGYINAPEG